MERDEKAPIMNTIRNAPEFKPGDIFKFGAIYDRETAEIMLKITQEMDGLSVRIIPPGNDCECSTKKGRWVKRTVPNGEVGVEITSSSCDISLFWQKVKEAKQGK